MTTATLESPATAKFGAAVVARVLPLVVVPALFGTFLLSISFEAQTPLLLACLISAAVGLYGWARDVPWLGGRGGLAATLLLGAGLVVGGAVVWNEAYWTLLGTQSIQREVFRRAMRTNYAPLYGLRQLASWKSAAVVLAVAGGWLAWVWRRPSDQPLRRWEWVLLLSLQLLLIITFARSEAVGLGKGKSASRMSGLTPGYTMFAEDAATFSSAGELMRTYVRRMPSLGWFSQHYPPGLLLLMRMDSASGLPLSLWAVILSCVAATPFVGGLAREAGLDASGRNAAVLLFATATGVLVYGTVNPGSIVLLPAAACAYFAARAARVPCEAASRGAAAGLGAAWALFVLFSFAATVFGTFLALAVAIGVYEKIIPWRRAGAAVLVAGASAAACLVLLRLATGWDALACFRQALAFHHAQQMDGGFDAPPRWVIRSFANLLAYLLSAAPITLLAGATLWRAARAGSRDLADVLAKAAGAAILLAAFSGSFFLETERIWLFYTPALAVIAGCEVKGRAVRDVVLLSLILACGAELTFMHYRP